MWTNLSRLGFDTETTGVDVLNDRIVTAAVIIQGQTETRRNWLADPGIEIPPAAAAVHGITTEHARANGAPSAQVLAEIADVLVSHMSAGNPLVAYNASYDLTLFEAELARNGLPTLSDRLGRVYPVIDPYFLDRAVDRYRRGPRKLENLAQHYEVAAQNFHNAEADVAMTLAVLDRMLQKYPELNELSLGELMALQEDAYTEFNNFIARRYGNDGPKGWPVAR